MADPATAPVPWQGLNHLALITNDMDATVRFWHGVLGAPLVATIGTATFRHYFFDFGPGSSVAFFEYVGETSERSPNRPGCSTPRPAIRPLLDGPARRGGAAGAAPPPDDHGSEVTDVVDHGFMRSIYFTDPNGIALEASWWSDDPTGSRTRLRRPTVLR